MKVFTVPGINGSGSQHWQTIWELRYGYSRVKQNNWGRPVFADWKTGLIQTLNALGEKDRAVFVAHSLGCHLVVKCLPLIKSRVAGILLVAPPDLTSPVFTIDLTDFAGNHGVLPDVSGYLVYSENDPFASIAFSEKLSLELGLHAFNGGRLGHINADSGHGEWNEGHELLVQFLKSLRVQTPGEQPA
jgi:hypothetical protein